MSGNSCGDELSAGRALKKGPWTAGEDAVLMEYVKKHGEGNWNAVQRNTGLSRCGKSCRLRWANHLRPNLKKGSFSPEEERLILELHAKLGNKWARMAAQLPGRTDNEIKNYWNTRIKRRQRQGLPLYPPDIQRQASAKHNLQTPATSVNPTITSPLPLLDPTISCFPETGRSLLTSVQHHYQQPQQHAQTFIFDGFQVPPPFSSPMPLFHQCLQQQQQLQQQHFKPLFTSGMAAPISATLELPSSQVPKPAHSLAATIDKSPPSLLDQCNGPLIGSLMLGTQQMASQGGDSCFTHPGNGKQDEWIHMSTLPLASFSQWDSPPPSIVSKLKKEETREMQAVEEDLSTLLGMFPAPAPIAPEWYNVSGDASDGQSGLVTDIEIGIDMKHLASSLSATSATASAAVAADQGWSLSSCSWNNMPGIC